MSDQILILTGAGAAELCRGLLETGKCIRVQFAMPDISASSLYGAAESHERSPLSPGKLIAAPELYGKRPKGPIDKDDDDDEYNGDFRRYAMLNCYALRGSRRTISAVLRVLANCPDAFRTEKSEYPNGFVIRCAASPEKVTEILAKIRLSLSSWIAA